MQEKKKGRSRTPSVWLLFFLRKLISTVEWTVSHGTLFYSLVLKFRHNCLRWKERGPGRIKTIQCGRVGATGWGWEWVHVWKKKNNGRYNLKAPETHQNNCRMKISHDEDEWVGAVFLKIIFPHPPRAVHVLAELTRVCLPHRLINHRMLVSLSAASCSVQYYCVPLTNRSERRCQNIVISGMYLLTLAFIINLELGHNGVPSEALQCNFRDYTPTSEEL